MANEPGTPQGGGEVFLDAYVEGDSLWSEEGEGSEVLYEPQDEAVKGASLPKEFFRRGQSWEQHAPSTLLTETLHPGRAPFDSLTLATALDVEPMREWLSGPERLPWKSIAEKAKEIYEAHPNRAIVRSHLEWHRRSMQMELARLERQRQDPLLLRVEQARRQAMPESTPSGFISRPKLDDYQRLFRQGSYFAGSYFQFERLDVLSALPERYDVAVALPSRQLLPSVRNRPSYEQGYDYQRQAITQAQIYGGTLMAASVGHRPEEGKRIYGKLSPLSFHPKVGYVSDDKGQIAVSWISTQNLTRALESNRSMENMLVFRGSATRVDAADATKKAQLRFEAQVSREIAKATEILLRLGERLRGSESDVHRVIVPGAFQDALAATGSKYLRADGQILPSLRQVMKRYARRQDTQFIFSSWQFSLFSDRSQSASVNEVKSILRTLAEQRRLTVLLDARVYDELWEVYRKLETNKPLTDQELQRYDVDFIRTLMRQEVFRRAPSPFHHEKSLFIFDANMQRLEFVMTGSANFSRESMLPLREHSKQKRRAAWQLYEQILGRKLGTNALAGTFNTELNVFIDREDDEGAAAYLDDITAQVRQHLAYNLGMYARMGFIHDERADPHQVAKLAHNLRVLARQLEGSGIRIDVRERYSQPPWRLQGLRTLVGLRVKVTSKMGIPGYQSEIEVTVGADGSVILPTRNQILTGSVYYNRSTNPREVPGRPGEVILPGTSRIFDPQQNFLAIVAGLGAAMNEQAASVLVREVFHKQFAPTGLPVTSEFLRNTYSSRVGTSLHDWIYALARGDFTNASLFYGRPLKQEEITRRLEGLIQLTESLQELSHPSTRWSRRRAFHATAETLLEVLQKSEPGLYTDIMYHLISQTPWREQLAETVQAQVRQMQDVVFIGALEQNSTLYGYAQAAHRLSVIGTTVDDMLPAPRGLAVYNPLPIRASGGMGVGAAGQYLRLIGAQGYLGQAQLGGLRSIVMTVSSLNEENIAFYDFPNLARGMPQLDYLTRKRLREYYRRVLAVLGEKKAKLDEQSEVFNAFGGATGLYYFMLPASKLEQFMQRFKNLMGARQAQQVDPTLYQRLLRGDTKNLPTDEADIYTDELRRVMGPNAYRRFQKLVVAHKGDVQAALRELRRSDTSPFQGHKGTLAPSVKRVEMAAGVHTMTDFYYLNADVNVSGIYGFGGVMKLRLQPKQLDHKVETIHHLEQTLSGTLLLLTRAQKVGLEAETVQAFLRTFGIDPRQLDEHSRRERIDRLQAQIQALKEQNRSQYEQAQQLKTLALAAAQQAQQVTERINQQIEAWRKELQARKQRQESLSQHLLRLQAQLQQELTRAGQLNQTMRGLYQMMQDAREERLRLKEEKRQAVVRSRKILQDLRARLHEIREKMRQEYLLAQQLTLARDEAYYEMQEVQQRIQAAISDWQQERQELIANLVQAKTNLEQIFQEKQTYELRIQQTKNIEKGILRLISDVSRERRAMQAGLPSAEATDASSLYQREREWTTYLRRLRNFAAPLPQLLKQKVRQIYPALTELQAQREAYQRAKDLFYLLFDSLLERRQSLAIRVSQLRNQVRGMHRLLQDSKKELQWQKQQYRLERIRARTLVQGLRQEIESLALQREMYADMMKQLKEARDEARRRAASMREDWQETLRALQQERQEAIQAKAKVEQEIERLQTERRQHLTRASQLRNLAKGLHRMLQDTKQQQNALQAEIDRIRGEKPLVLEQVRSALAKARESADPLVQALGQALEVEQTPDGLIQFILRSGLYKQIEDGTWRKVGSFTEDGRVILSAGRTPALAGGSYYEPIYINNRAFNLRYQNAISYFYGDVARHEDPTTGTVTLTKKYVVMAEPTSGIRGFDLFKGPGVFLEKEYFAQQFGLGSNVYAVASTTHFKSYSLTTAHYVLTTEFEALQRLSGRELATLLFPVFGAKSPQAVEAYLQAAAEIGVNPLGLATLAAVAGKYKDYTKDPAQPRATGQARLGLAFMGLNVLLDNPTAAAAQMRAGSAQLVAELITKALTDDKAAARLQRGFHRLLQYFAKNELNRYAVDIGDPNLKALLALVDTVDVQRQMLRKISDPKARVVVGDAHLVEMDPTATPEHQRYAQDFIRAAFGLPREASGFQRASMRPDAALAYLELPKTYTLSEGAKLFDEMILNLQKAEPRLHLHMFDDSSPYAGLVEPESDAQNQLTKINLYLSEDAWLKDDAQTVNILTQKMQAAGITSLETQVAASLGTTAHELIHIMQLLKANLQGNATSLSSLYERLSLAKSQTEGYELAAHLAHSQRGRLAMLYLIENDKYTLELDWPDELEAFAFQNEVEAVRDLVVQYASVAPDKRLELLTPGSPTYQKLRPRLIEQMVAVRRRYGGGWLELNRLFAEAAKKFYTRTGLSVADLEQARATYQARATQALAQFLASPEGTSYLHELAETFFGAEVAAAFAQLPAASQRERNELILQQLFAYTDVLTAHIQSIGFRTFRRYAAGTVMVHPFTHALAYAYAPSQADALTRDKFLAQLLLLADLDLARTAVQAPEDLTPEVGNRLNIYINLVQAALLPSGRTREAGLGFFATLFPESFGSARLGTKATRPSLTLGKWLQRFFAPPDPVYRENYRRYRQIVDELNRLKKLGLLRLVDDVPRDQLYGQQVYTLRKGKPFLEIFLSPVATLKGPFWDRLRAALLNQDLASLSQRALQTLTHETVHALQHLTHILAASADRPPAPEVHTYSLTGTRAEADLTLLGAMAALSTAYSDSLPFLVLGYSEGNVMMESEAFLLERRPELVTKRLRTLVDRFTARDQRPLPPWPNLQAWYRLPAELAYSTLVSEWFADVQAYRRGVERQREEMVSRFQQDVEVWVYGSAFQARLLYGRARLLGVKPSVRPSQVLPSDPMLSSAETVAWSKELVTLGLAKAKELWAASGYQRLSAVQRGVIDRYLVRTVLFNPTAHALSYALEIRTAEEFRALALFFDDVVLRQLRRQPTADLADILLTRAQRMQDAYDPAIQLVQEQYVRVLGVQGLVSLPTVQRQEPPPLYYRILQGLRVFDGMLASVLASRPHARRQTVLDAKAAITGSEPPLLPPDRTPTRILRELVGHAFTITRREQAGYSPTQTVFGSKERVPIELQNLIWRGEHELRMLGIEREHMLAYAELYAVLAGVRSYSRREAVQLLPQAVLALPVSGISVGTPGQMVRLAASHAMALYHSDILGTRGDLPTRRAVYQIVRGALPGDALDIEGRMRALVAFQMQANVPDLFDTPYLLTKEDAPALVAQQYRQLFGREPRHAGDSPMDYVASLIGRTLERYLKRREKRAIPSLWRLLTDDLKKLRVFHYDLAELEGLQVLRSLYEEKVPALKGELEQIFQMDPKFFERLVGGLPREIDRERTLTAWVQARLERRKAHLYKQIHQQLQRSLPEDYLEGLRQLSEAGLLKDAAKTHALFLPSFSLMPTKQGGYRVVFHTDLREHYQHGLLFGYDVLESLALSFRGYVDDVLKIQHELLRYVVEVLPDITRKIEEGEAITANEAESLLRYQSLLRQSQAAPYKLFERRLAGQALGDRLVATGGVAVAVSSWTLGPQQALLGERALHSLNRGSLSQLRQEFFRELEALRKRREVLDETGYRKLMGVYQTLAPANDLLTLGWAYVQAETNQARLEAAKQVRAALEKAFGDIPEVISVARSGAPLGAAGEGLKENWMRALGVENADPRLLLSVTKAATLLMLPAASSLHTMLGDFDGDTFQMVSTQLGRYAHQLRKAFAAHRQVVTELTEVIAHRRRLLSGEISAPEAAIQAKYFQALAKQLETELYQKQQEIETLQAELTAYQQRRQELESRGLEGFKRSVGAMLGFGRTFSERFTPGEMAQMLTQARAVTDRMTGGKEVYNRLLDQQIGWEALKELDRQEKNKEIDLAQVDPRQTRELLALRAYVASLGPERTVASLTPDEVVAYYTYRYQAEQFALDLQKNAEKLIGTVMDTESFEAMQATIGHIGTQLIGQTYNTIIPMAGKMFTLAALLNLAERSEGFRQLLSRRLGESYNLEKLKRQFYALQSFLQNLQQAIRDSLKAKSEGGLGLLAEEELQKKFREIEAHQKATPEQVAEKKGASAADVADQQRLEAVRDFVYRKVGEGVTPNDPGAHQLTMFASMLELAELLSSKNLNEQRLYETFIEKRGSYSGMVARSEEARTRLERYEAFRRAHPGAGVRDFMYREIIENISQARTEFIYQNISGGAGLDFYVAQLDQLAKEVTQLQRYQQARETEPELTIAQYLERQKQQDPSLTIQKEQLEILLRDGVDETTLAMVEAYQRTPIPPEASPEEAQKARVKASIRASIDATNPLTPEMLEILGELKQITQAGREQKSIDEFLQKSVALDADNLRQSLVLGLRMNKIEGPDNQIAVAAEILDLVSETYKQVWAEREQLDLSSTEQVQEEVSKRLMTKDLHILLGMGTSSEDQKVWNQLLADLYTQKDPQTGRSYAELIYQENAMLTTYRQFYDAVLEMLAEGEYSPDLVAQLEKQMQRKMERIRRANLEELGTLRNYRDWQSYIAEARLEVQLLERTRTLQETDRSRSILLPDPRLEWVGAALVPVLIGVLTGGISWDERFAMTALDLLQSLSQSAISSNTLVSELVGAAGAQEKAERAFAAAQRYRIRNTIDQNGLLLGAIQGAAQEVIYMQSSRIAYEAVDALLPKGIAPVPGLRGIGIVASEILASMIALSATRAVSRTSGTRDQWAEYDRASEILSYLGKALTETLLAPPTPAEEQLSTESDTTRLDEVEQEFLSLHATSEPDLGTNVLEEDEDGDDTVLESEFV